MKYIKKFESNVDYEVGIFTISQTKELYQNILDMNDYKYDLKDKIHYFSYDDIYIRMVCQIFL